MMNDVIYIVYYAHNNEPVRVIKAFHSLMRTKEYVNMLISAPYPGQSPAGYTYTQIHLS